VVTNWASAALLAVAKATPTLVAQNAEIVKLEMRFVMKASRLNSHNSLSILDLSC
jgi:hypothetical protein